MNISTLRSLSDADLASRSPLAAQARAMTLVPQLDPDHAFRATTVTAYVQARSRGDWAGELRHIAAASDYDRAHPGEPSLYDELHAIEMYGAQYSEVA
ncbi:hypothetical protein N4G70_29030 [Streptomyces sp. ASQP_92]|uniref:hypothetical protein n=1 Tax=Streptomyces sp. ASQP_92 TaxID=2979116 RepID=UPI0021C02459|nr:hypothetical protein [Streptomyces sp. ASQP_92]MCT9092885.1 hypothetical protein [Streptomyces sp. ASQP_92]